MADLAMLLLLFVVLAVVLFTVPVLAFLAGRALARRWGRDDR